MHKQQQQQVQQRQVQQLQRQHAAEQQRKQRQSVALETGDEGKHGQTVWIIPEFTPQGAEEDYIIESVREALPEYHCKMAVDGTDRPMTEERIMELLAGGPLEDDDAV